MRLALFSDIHGNWTAFQAMLADFESAQAQTPFDAIWCLGDLGAFGAQPAQCVAKVRAMQAHYGEDVFKCIGGNTDRYLTEGTRMASAPAKEPEKLEERIRAYSQRDNVLNWNLAQLSWEDYAYLDSIKGRELHKQVNGYGVVIGVHGIPGDDEGNQLRPDSPDEEANDALLDREGRLALAAHTHLAMNRSVGAWQVVNAGSVGMSFSQRGRAEWAIITIEAGAVHVDLRAVPYDVKQAIAEAEACGYPDVGWLASRLEVTFG